MPESTTNLPVAQAAPVLVKYEAARQALAECSRVDECKDWSDKAAALAAYAKQAKDSTLHNLALRIQQRAQRRMGEVLKQIPRGDEATRFGREGAHPPASHRREGDHPPVTRTQVATDAGLSDHQRKTALRIASVPAQEFEAAVESGHPPTVTEMAMRGTVAKPAVPEPTITPANPAVVARAQELLQELGEFCTANDPTAIALSPVLHAAICRAAVETIDAWLDRFVTRLPAGSAEIF